MKDLKNNQILHSFVGGGNGGVLIASGSTALTYDFIVIAEPSEITVMTDDEDTDLVTSKGISGETLNPITISAGEGRTIKSLTYTGGQIWGFTYPTTSVLEA